MKVICEADSTTEDCLRCSRVGHVASQCRVARPTCSSCGLRGHLRSQCRRMQMGDIEIFNCGA